MIKKVVFLPIARSDLYQAEEYYSAIDAGLGNQFMEEVAECITYIQQYPGGFQRRGKFRQAPLDIFPYVIVYEDLPEAIVVIRVANTWRRIPERSIPEL